MKRAKEPPLPPADETLPVDHSFDMTALGTRFKAAREERGLTMRAVAEKAGYSVTHISQIERGSTCPTIGALTRIATALGHDAHFFLEAERRPEVLVTARGRARQADRPEAGSTLRLTYLSEGISGGRLRVTRNLIRPHASPDKAEVIWLPVMMLLYVLRGSAVLSAGGEGRTYSEGDALTVQPGVRVTMYNPGPDDVEIMSLVRNEQVRWTPGRAQLIAPSLEESDPSEQAGEGEILLEPAD